MTVVDRRNHLLFQPLIYQVAAGALSSGEVATPIRHMLKGQANATVLMGAVTGVGVDSRRVILDEGEDLESGRPGGACRRKTSYFGHDEWQEVTCGLKTLADAVDLRDRIFGAFEEAERAADPPPRQWLTFAVVGGGPTGVEISGQLAILARHTMKRNFRRIDPTAARIVLHGRRRAGGRCVQRARPPPEAARRLSTWRDGAWPRRWSPESTHRSGARNQGRSRRIATRTVISAAGVQTAGIAEVVAQAAGAGSDRAGHVEVNPDLDAAGPPRNLGDRRRSQARRSRWQAYFPGSPPWRSRRRVTSLAIRDGHPASKPFKYFRRRARWPISGAAGRCVRSGAPAVPD